MKFLNKILQDDERPLCRSGLHGIYLLSSGLWFVGLSALGWAADYNLWIHFGNYVPAYEVNTPFFRFGLAPGMIGWLFTAGGAFIFASEFINYMSTDLVVTTKRLLYKTGFMKIKMDATEINDILGTHVDQGWFGQFLGYGKLHLDCRFIEDVYIPYVKNPYGIVKMIQKVRGTLEPHAAHPEEKKPKEERIVSQTLIQISGSGPVYLVDKVPDDPKAPLKALPKSLGDNMLSAFKRKA